MGVNAVLFRTTLRNCLLIGYYVVALETGSEQFPKTVPKIVPKWNLAKAEKNIMFFELPFVWGFM